MRIFSKIQTKEGTIGHVFLILFVTFFPLFFYCLASLSARVGFVLISSAFLTFVDFFVSHTFAPSVHFLTSLSCWLTFSFSHQLGCRFQPKPRHQSRWLGWTINNCSCFSPIRRCKRRHINGFVCDVQKHCQLGIINFVGQRYFGSHSLLGAADRHFSQIARCFGCADSRQNEWMQGQEVQWIKKLVQQSCRRL